MIEKIIKISSLIKKDALLNIIGNAILLDQPMLGIFSSVKCPARLILNAHDTANKLSKDGSAVISGFQSPVEKEIFELLIRGNSPIIICPARGLGGMRIPVAWREKILKGQLLVVSPFPIYVKRPTADTAVKRNNLVAELAQTILIIHASVGGRLEEQVKLWESSGKKVKRLE